MLHSLLQTVALTTPEESFSFRASTAGIVSLQGMLTIFLVLAIIWGAIEIMHRLLSKNDDPKPKREPKPAKPKKAEKSADTAPAPNADDAAIAAAIAAALAARAQRWRLSQRQFPQPLQRTDTRVTSAWYPSRERQPIAEDKKDVCHNEK